MFFSTWLVYVSVAAITIISPGPAMLLAVNNSLQYGMSRVVLSSLGNVLGLFCVSAFAMAGVGMLIKASAVAFFCLKVFGAGYLFYLGLKQWMSQKNAFLNIYSETEAEEASQKKIFVEAWLLALTNPKSILFFSALFPQFLSSSNVLLPQFLILTFTFMAISFASLMVYGLSATLLRNWISINGRHVWFNKFFGGAFMLFGIGMLAMRV